MPLNVKKLIQPSVELMGRFGYRRKMALLGFFLMIPLAVFLFLLVSEINSSLSLERSKGEGLIYMGHLLTFLQEVQQHRGISAAYLSGDANFKRLLDEQDKIIAAKIKVLDTIDNRYGEKFGTSASWGRIKQQWKAIDTAAGAGANGPDVILRSIRVHTELINSILSLISQVTGSSGLVLDLRRDRYYLVDAVSDKLPIAFENAGRIRALGLSILVAGAAGRQQRAQADIFSGLVRLSLDRAQEDLRRAIDANPQIGPDIEPYMADLAGAADKFDVLSRELVEGRLPVSAADFYSSMTKTIDSGYLLDRKAMAVLDRLAAKRERRLVIERDILMAAAAASFLFIFYMYLGASISILDSLGALVAASKKMAAGDLNAQVPVSTSDEMSLVAGSFNDMAGSLRERTEKLRAQSEQLQESNRELDRFASIASHDLQEPLIALASNLKLLERRAREAGEDTRVLIEDSLAVALRMQNLVRNLLQYSRAGAGSAGQTAVFEEIESSASLRSAMVSLSALIEESGTSVTYGQLPAVPADPVQLSQLFQNLISNAIKFRRKEDPPKIRISAEKTDREWVFSVRDNGIGILPEHTGRVFEMFFRAREKQVRGTGIGLATCKKIVERHGGRIWVESVPGEGSVFRFTLPFHRKTDH